MADYLRTTLVTFGLVFLVSVPWALYEIAAKLEAIRVELWRARK